LPNQTFICRQDQNSARKAKLIARGNASTEGRFWLVAEQRHHGDRFWRREAQRLEPSPPPDFAADTLNALASLRSPSFQVQLAAPHQPTGDVGGLQRRAFGR
jgi:hypothetical protein